MGIIKNPDILREKVQGIEARLRGIMDGKDLQWTENAWARSRVKMLLLARSDYLNRMFRGTPEEVRRFEALNTMLLHKSDEMRRRTAMLWESVLTMRQMPEFDDYYGVRGVLRICGDRSDEESVLRLPDDDYYGSDFALANEALVSSMPDGWVHLHCGHGIHPRKTATQGDGRLPEFCCPIDDVENWAEGPLCHPSLSHIRICHVIHDIVTHVDFSIPDLLRINNFHTEVRLEITNDITQSGVRSFEPGFRSWD